MVGGDRFPAWLTGYLRTGARQPRLCTAPARLPGLHLHMYLAHLVLYNHVSSLLRADDSIQSGVILCEDVTTGKLRWIVMMVIREVSERNFPLTKCTVPSKVSLP